MRPAWMVPSLWDYVISFRDNTGKILSLIWETKLTQNYSISPGLRAEIHKLIWPLWSSQPQTSVWESRLSCSVTCLILKCYLEALKLRPLAFILWYQVFKSQLLALTQTNIAWRTKFVQLSQKNYPKYLTQTHYGDNHHSLWLSCSMHLRAFI